MAESTAHFLSFDSTQNRNKTIHKLTSQACDALSKTTAALVLSH